MDLHHAAVAADQPHGPEDLAVVDHQHVGIGGEELEGADALVVDQALHVGEGLVVHVGHDHVRADIDGRDRGALVPVGKAFERAGSLHLGGEVNQRGGTAEGRRLGAGVERVGGARRPEIPVEVGMHVDPARQDQQPRRIVCGDVLAHGQIDADHADAACLHQDVGPVVVHRGHDPPVPNHGRRHRRLPSLAGRLPCPAGLSCRARRHPSTAAPIPLQLLQGVGHGKDRAAGPDGATAPRAEWRVALRGYARKRAMRAERAPGA